jgi:lysyl-tRNA synthetase class 2
MKRLLAAGSGPIFQIARVFRDDELGRWHNPEFSLLEWYQLDCDHVSLLDEVDALLQSVAGFPPLVTRTYRQAFLDACALDPFQAGDDELCAVLAQYELHQVLPLEGRVRDEALFLLMTHVVEPALAHLDHPVALVDFPPSQAALARIEQGVAQRFEVYYRGVELANGFHELTDAGAQAARFNADNAARLAAGLSVCAPDHYLLAALEHGLPACSGVAVGLDRLLALMLNENTLAAVLAFDFSRA